MLLQWRHNGHEGVSNQQPDDCLLNRLFRRRSKKTSKLRVTGLCEGNSPGTGEFPAQMSSYAENVSIWWRHHVLVQLWYLVSQLWWVPGNSLLSRGSQREVHHPWWHRSDLAMENIIPPYYDFPRGRDVTMGPDRTPCWPHVGPMNIAIREGCGQYRVTTKCNT